MRRCVSRLLILELNMRLCWGNFGPGDWPFAHLRASSSRLAYWFIMCKKNTSRLKEIPKRSAILARSWLKGFGVRWWQIACTTCMFGSCRTVSINFAIPIFSASLARVARPCLSFDRVCAFSAGKIFWQLSSYLHPSDYFILFRRPFQFLWDNQRQ